jgi:hypothetical protein
MRARVCLWELGLCVMCLSGGGGDPLRVHPSPLPSPHPLRMWYVCVCVCLPWRPLHGRPVAWAFPMGRTASSRPRLWRTPRSRSSPFPTWTSCPSGPLRTFSRWGCMGVGGGAGVAQVGAYARRVHLQPLAAWALVPWSVHASKFCWVGQPGTKTGGGGGPGRLGFAGVMLGLHGWAWGVGSPRAGGWPELPRVPGQLRHPDH